VLLHCPFIADLYCTNCNVIHCTVPFCTVLQSVALLATAALVLLVFSLRYVVKGVTTNMPHVRSCMANPAFRSGQYDTSFIPTYYGGPRETHAGLLLVTNA
jgi:hypothetical protein